MDTTPPYHRSEPRLRSKSASRLARITDFATKTQEIPSLSLDIVPSSSPKTITPPPSSPMSPKPPNSLPLRELLLLSSSPLRKSRTRLAERLDMGEDVVGEPNGPRKRCKNRGGGGGQICASPRNNRRSRRRVEQEIREEKEVGFVEEVAVKVKKRRQSGRSKKEKLSLGSSSSSIPSSSQSPKINECEGSNLDRIGLLISDLIMWKDVAKSSLWFGFGSLCFLSSWFSRGIGFSLFSAMSQIGLLLLGLSFFSNTIRQRTNGEHTRKFKLNEEDILRAARVILPAANLAISKTGELFSGEPSMTLKVVPFLLVGAEYGHLITIRRMCALGFFIGFTAPKLYSCYAVQINKKVEYLRRWASEVWGSCSHKKIVVASAVTAFWNLSSMKTRIFSAFIFLVILRYYRQQHSDVQVEEGEAEGLEPGEQQQDQQALVIVEGGLQE